MPRQRVNQDAVFLNIPYDPQFERLYLAYIVGLTVLGFVPRATLGIPSGARRLERIFELIQRCRYSVHDLSRAAPAPCKCGKEQGTPVQSKILGIRGGPPAPPCRSCHYPFRCITL